MPEQKKPVPTPDTVNFRETTKLSQDETPTPAKPQNKPFRETHALDDEK